MDSGRRRKLDERGETLIELLAALAILGVAGVAIMTGLMISVKTSQQHSQQATGGAYVRSWAESIQTAVDDAGLPQCSDAVGFYLDIGEALVAGDVSLDGFAPELATDGQQTAQIMHWSGSAWANGCSGDGVQRILLRLTGPGDASHSFEEDLTLILREPCNGDADTLGDTPCA